jgi:hypothetical protein
MLKKVIGELYMIQKLTFVDLCYNNKKLLLSTLSGQSLLCELKGCGPLDKVDEITKNYFQSLQSQEIESKDDILREFS